MRAIRNGPIDCQQNARRWGNVRVPSQPTIVFTANDVHGSSEDFAPYVPNLTPKIFLQRDLREVSPSRLQIEKSSRALRAPVGAGPFPRHPFLEEVHLTQEISGRWTIGHTLKAVETEIKILWPARQLPQGRIVKTMLAQ